MLEQYWSEYSGTGNDVVAIQIRWDIPTCYWSFQKESLVHANFFLANSYLHMWKINPSEITHTPKDGLRNVKQVEREGCFMTHSSEWWLAGGSRHLPGSCHKSVVSCCISLIASICKYVWSMRRMGGSVYLCRSRWNICIILNIAACFPRSLPMAFICSFLDDLISVYLSWLFRWNERIFYALSHWGWTCSCGIQWNPTEICIEYHHLVLQWPVYCLFPSKEWDLPSTKQNMWHIEAN